MKIYLDKLSVELLEQLQSDENLVSVMLCTNSKDMNFWTDKERIALVDKLFAILEKKQHLSQVTIITSNYDYLYPSVLQTKAERLCVCNTAIRSYAVTNGGSYDYVQASYAHQPIIDKIIASNSELHEPKLKIFSNPLIHKIHLQDCIEDAAIQLTTASQVSTISEIKKCVDALQQSIDNIDTLAVCHQLNQLMLTLSKYPDIFSTVHACIYQLKSALIKYAACHKQFEFECFISNSNALSNIWSMGKSPNTYAKLCHASALAGARFIKNSKQPKALDIYYFLANLRHEIAMHLKQTDKQVLGIKRTFYAGETPIAAAENGRYSDYAVDLRARLIRLFAYSKDQAEKSGFQVLPLGVINGYDADPETNRISAKFSRTTIALQVIKDGFPLSRICLKHFGEGEGTFLVEVDYTSQTWPHIKDTDPRLFSELFAKIEVLFNDYMKDPSPTYQNALLIGKMAWYYAHIMPCVRGSAATTEMFAYSLFLACGFPFMPYTCPITMDLEAIFEPDIEVFATRFADNFFLDLRLHCKETLDLENETSQESVYKKRHMMFSAADETHDTDDKPIFKLDV